MMLQKEHLTEHGLQAILNLRASLNLGLSESLKTAFPFTIPIARPIVSKQEIPDPHPCFCYAASRAKDEWQDLLQERGAFL